MTESKIVAKIQKLLALSKSPNRHEAEAALAKANELMTEHQISMSQVEFTTYQKSPFSFKRFEAPGFKMRLAWPVWVAMGAGYIYDCEVLSPVNSRGTWVTFVGMPDNIKLAEATFRMLLDFWFFEVEKDLKAAKASHADLISQIRIGLAGRLNAEDIEYAIRTSCTFRNIPYKWEPKTTMDFKQGHGVRFGAAIAKKGQELQEARRYAVRSAGRDLVVLDDALQDYMQKELKVRKAKKRKISAGSALGQEFGQRAADRAPLHSGVLPKAGA